MSDLKDTFGTSASNTDSTDPDIGLRLNPDPKPKPKPQGYQWITWDKFSDKLKPNNVDGQSLDLDLFTNEKNQGLKVGLNGLTGGFKTVWDFTGDKSKNFNFSAGMNSTHTAIPMTRAASFSTDPSGIYPEINGHGFELNNTLGVHLKGDLPEAHTRLSATGGYSLSERDFVASVGMTNSFPLEKGSLTIHNSLTGVGIKDRTLQHDANVEMVKKVNENLSIAPGIFYTHTFAEEPRDRVTGYVKAVRDHVKVGNTFFKDGKISMTGATAFEKTGEEKLQLSQSFNVSATHPLPIKRYTLEVGAYAGATLGQNSGISFGPILNIPLDASMFSKKIPDMKL